MNIGEQLVSEWHQLTHHDQEAPVTAPQPAHASSGNLGLLVADAKDHLDQGIDWLRVISAQHLPALEAIAANPVVQAVLAAGLGPAEEQMIVALVGLLAAKAAAGAPAAPAVPVAPPAALPEPHDAGTMAAEGPAPEQPAA